MLRRSLLRLPPLPFNARAKFCTSSTKFANRAIVYTETGNPATVLTALTYPSLPPPPPNSLNIRIRLAPINPADINVIEGVYPAKPALTASLSPGQELTKPVYVSGNEALAEIMQVGSGVERLKKGDWVIMAKQQAGTWSSARTVDASDVIKLPADTLSEVNAATITVNPPTAYNMLRDFVELGEGDWVLQNGANSAVGQAVMQIAASRGLKTINFVRNRPDIDALKKQLSDLGATHVLTYDDLSDKALSRTVKQWTEGRPIRLMLNCVGGKPTAQMTRFLGTDAHLVSYGAMSKQPLALPTSAFIFKNLVAHGFWQSRWYDTHSRAEREALMHALAALKLKEPEHEIVTVLGWMSDVEAKEKVHGVIERMAEGKYGKKVLLRIEEPED